MIELQVLGSVDLRDSDGREIEPILRRSKRLALLVYLAAAAPHGFHRRDTLLALFWPDADQDRARNALGQAVHLLRSHLGTEVVVSRGSELGLDHELIACDAVRFEQALNAERLEEALEYYKGDLLPGFFLSGEPEFERWLEAERGRLRRRAAEAARALSQASEKEGNPAEAVRWARRAASLAPYDEAATRRVIELLDRGGDRLGALHAYETFVERMRREFDATPTPETRTLVERIRARERPTPSQVSVEQVRGSTELEETLPAGGPTAKPRWRWQRTARFAAGLVVGLGLAGGLLLLGTRGFGPPDNLIGEGVLEPRDRIVLADFENHTTDSLLARAVTEAFRVDFEQSRIVRLVPEAEVRAVLGRMRRNPVAPVDDAAAREVAVREQFKAVIAGRINEAGVGYLLSARLLSAASGEVLASAGETAADSTELIAAIDRLSDELRKQIGESLKEIRGNPPLARVTTASLQALRNYTQAMDAERRGDGGGRARQLLAEAVALDSAFAMAHRKIGSMYLNTGQSQQAEQALSKAFRHSDRLTERERYQVAGLYYITTQQLSKAVDSYRNLLSLYPDESLAMINLAAVLNELHDYAAAESLALRGIEVAPGTWTVYANAVEAQIGLGKFQEADTVLGLWEAALPGNRLRKWYAAQAAAAFGDYDAAMVHLEALASQHPRLASISMANVAIIRGRFAEAEDHLRDYLAQSSSFRGRLAASLRLASIDLWYRGDSARATQTIAAALERYPLDSIPLRNRPYSRLAEFYAMGGRASRARDVLAQRQAAGLEPLESPSHELGVVALAEGRYDDAIQELARVEYHSPIRNLPPLARAYDLAGLADSAIAVYERFLETPYRYRAIYATPTPEYGSDPWWRAWIFERLGQLYELRGEKQRAAEYFAKLVDLWNDADPELQPRVEAARRAIERLRVNR